MIGTTPGRWKQPAPSLAKGTNPMTTATYTTTPEDDERPQRWAELVSRYQAAKAQVDADCAVERQMEDAGLAYEIDRSLTAKLDDSRDDLAHTYAADWQGVGLKARLFTDFYEDADWRDHVTPGSPTYWLAEIIDCAGQIVEGEDDLSNLALLRLMGSIEACARAFVTRSDGYAAWGAVPAALVSVVDLITGMQEDGRRLSRGDRQAAWRAAIYDAVWSGSEAGQ